MRRFVDYNREQIVLAEDAERHIALIHPEVDIEQIRLALFDPDEVRKSSYKLTSVLYYRLKATRYFVCVVVKSCPDGKFISSVMTTTKPKTGKVIYVKKP